ncbi:MAG: hypothetical protein K2W92_10070 [Alphaproteobacteria bacterium]|nr:hypothetical protein [Alphaproteobacteria bacterium]
MKEKFFLYLTNSTTTLYKGAHEKIYSLQDNFEQARSELHTILIRSPKIPLRLLIDLNHQDIREEKLPPLLPWDRVRFFFYKKAELYALDGYVGFTFFKQEGDSYFRWIHISQNDSLSTWLSWLTSLANPDQGTFFVPLEARGFLKSNLPSSKGYQMLIYPISSHENRHVIFKGNRLLLSRLSQKEEDLKTSLHFISRAHQDIHENLQVLSLVKEDFVTLPEVKVLPNPQAFLNFLASQRHPTFTLQRHPPFRFLWLRISMGIVFVGLLILIGLYFYQGYDFKNKKLEVRAKIDILKAKTHHLRTLLESKDVRTLRTALVQYHHLKSLTINPLKIINQLSTLLNMHKLRLHQLKWHNEAKPELIISFWMGNRLGSALAAQFESFLTSCQNIFPGSHIHVLKAPFNSSSHEIYKSHVDQSLPLAQIKIVL